MALAVVVVLGVLALLLAVRSRDAASPTTTTTAVPTMASSSTTPTTVDAFALEAGDCFDDPEGSEVAEVRTQPCDEPHDNEVYLVDELEGPPGAAFPGEEEVAARVEARCIDAFAGFVGLPRERSTLGVFTLGPTEASWAQGDRELLCAVYEPDGQLGATAEGSAR